MNEIAQKIQSEVSDEQFARLQKVEHLMIFKSDLQEDREATLEILTEVVERRAETCRDLGVDLTALIAVFDELQAAFESVKNSAQAAQLEAMKA